MGRNWPPPVGDRQGPSMRCLWFLTPSKILRRDGSSESRSGTPGTCSYLAVEFGAWCGRVPTVTATRPDSIRSSTETLRSALPADRRDRSTELARSAATAGEMTFLEHTVAVDGPDGVD